MQLSEPYTIYTYRYFLHQWPKLCYFAFDGDKAFGTVICKMDMHREHMRGYVAMLVVDKAYRGKGAGRFQSCAPYYHYPTHACAVLLASCPLPARSSLLHTHSPAPAGSELVKMAIREMIRDGCEEVVLEAEVCNTGALMLYQALGFVRDKRLSRYYLNGVDAYRLKLLLPLTEAQEALLLLKSQKEAGGAVDGDDSEASMD